jgi:hypothetical protein
MEQWHGTGQYRSVIVHNLLLVTTQYCHCNVFRALGRNVELTEEITLKFIFFFVLCCKDIWGLFSLTVIGCGRNTLTTNKLRCYSWQTVKCYKTLLTFSHAVNGESLWDNNRTRWRVATSTLRLSVYSTFRIKYFCLCAYIECQKPLCNLYLKQELCTYFSAAHIWEWMYQSHCKSAEDEHVFCRYSHFPVPTDT